MLVDCKRIVTRLSIERKGEQVNLKGDVWKATGGEKGDQTMAAMMADVLLGRAAAGPPKGGLKDPKTGKTIQVTIPLNSIQNNGKLSKHLTYQFYINYIQIMCCETVLLIILHDDTFFYFCLSN